MTQHEVARTLVKSAPELWEVCSDPDSLSRHLRAFGEIRITRVEPETTVAWEGERASGTVRIEPAGWGTRVILTATPVALGAAEPGLAPGPEPRLAPGPEPQPEPGRGPEPQLEAPVRPRPGFFRRLGGVLFRSLVTPVEIPDGAFGSPPEAETALPEAYAELPDPAAEALPDPAAEAALPDPAAEPAHPAPAEPALDPGSVLAGVLDRLGSDHHRPFSRG